MATQFGGGKTPALTLLYHVASAMWCWWRPFRPLRKARLHRKVTTSIFFESSGGQQHKEASLAEIRLAVAEPGLDVGNVETVLEALQTNCYFLTTQNNRYRFSLTPNLNKLLSDRRANIKQSRMDERVRSEVQKVFAQQAGVERVYFPERSNQVPDRPAITLIVMAPDQGLGEPETLAFVEPEEVRAGPARGHLAHL